MIVPHGHSTGRRQGIQETLFSGEIFESALYNSRFLVILAVIGSLAAAAILFLKGSVESFKALRASDD